MALKGIKVIEMAGLAPAPLCGMILSDFGAKVIQVNKTKEAADMDHLTRGKKRIAVNLRDAEGQKVIRNLCQTADVFLEPFRPGVMEKYGLGPTALMADNPRLVYARLTGYGHHGPLAARAGHDINYLAISGVLSTLGCSEDTPQPPVNILADFAGGGLTCAFGILMALFARERSGRGQVVDSSMVEGAAYVSQWLFRSRDMPFVWGNSRGKNALDGGSHFYNTYRTKDNKFVAVGALEPQFYAELLKGLNLTTDDLPHVGDFSELKKKLAAIFMTKTREEWGEIFDNTDACVTPILDMDEAAKHPHNVARNSFIKSDKYPVPAPAPQLSETPGLTALKEHSLIGEHTVEVLSELGYSAEKLAEMQKAGVIEQHSSSKL